MDTRFQNLSYHLEFAKCQYEQKRNNLYNNGLSSFEIDKAILDGKINLLGEIIQAVDRAKNAYLPIDTHVQMLQMENQQLQKRVEDLFKVCEANSIMIEDATNRIACLGG